MNRITVDRPTMGHPTRLKWRVEAVLALWITVLSFILVTLVAIMMFGDAPGSTNMVPICTDAIADAGGICKGEPLPPCPEEDSDNCYWDGGRNGLGRTFVTVEGVTHYQEVE